MAEASASTSASGKKKKTYQGISHRSFIRKSGIVSELSHVVLLASVAADIRMFNEVCEGRQSGLQFFLSL
jgi:hypothetical protein